MSKFNLDEQYRIYLERVRLDESKMHPVQKVETKRAFMGACGQILLLMRNDVAEIEDEDEAVRILESLLDQALKFWADEI